MRHLSLLAALALCAFAWAVVQDKKEGAAPEKMRFTFEDVEPGKLPAGWSVAETEPAGTTAVWRVEKDAQAAGGERSLKLAENKNSGGTYNLCLHEKPWPADLEMDVKLRADGGTEDQGGGLVWRLKDVNNYYIARWNPLERNIRVYKVQNMKRTQFATANVDNDPKAWHLMKIEMRGKKITVQLDGKTYLEHEDGTFPDGGKIGFWTKADARTSFDDLEVEPAAK
jgi:hypothetical protein